MLFIVIICLYMLYSIAAYDGQMGQVASKGQWPYIPIPLTYTPHSYNTYSLVIHIIRRDRLHDLAASS